MRKILRRCNNNEYNDNICNMTAAYLVFRRPCPVLDFAHGCQRVSSLEHRVAETQPHSSWGRTISRAMSATTKEDYVRQAYHRIVLRHPRIVKLDKKKRLRRVVPSPRSSGNKYSYLIHESSASSQELETNDKFT